MRIGAPFRMTWTQGGKALYRNEGKFEYDMQGFFAPLANADSSPLAAGPYRLTFTVDEQVWLAGEVTVEGQAGFSTQPYFGQPAFWPEFNETQRWPIDVGSEFQQGITTLYLFWPYADVPVNTPIKATWYHNGNLFAQFAGALDQPRGIYWIKNYRQDKAALEPGDYRVVVEVNGEAVLADACAVLPTQGEAPPPAQTAQRELGPVMFASEFDLDAEESQESFESASGRAWRSVSRTDGAALERGLYTFNVFVNDAVVVAAQCPIR